MAEARAGGGEAAIGLHGRRDVDAKQIEELKKLYGFDKPPLRSLLRDAQELRAFDLGTSFLHNQDVWELIKSKLPVSISLGLWTFLLTYLISIPLGVAKAVREGIAVSTRSTTVLVLIGFAHSRFRARHAADRAVRGRHVPRLVPAARPHVRQLGEPVLAGAHRRLFLAPRAAAHLLRDRQLRDGDAPHQEHVRRGDPQAVRAGGAREGPVQRRVLYKHVSATRSFRWSPDFRPPSSARSSRGRS